MSWISEYKYTWYERLAMNVLKIGPIPKHVAFIMDGNRRFAKSENIEKLQGHSKGFDKLAQCLRWCLDVGIEEVTTFAFSIENFKRSEDEVDGLMNLAVEKFQQFTKETKRIHENGVRLRIIGNISLLRQDLQEVISEAILETENNNKLFLNIAFAYTSKDELTSSVQSVLELGDELKNEDIDEILLDHCLYTKNSPEPDLLFRTSGESRLSDFLMWQLTSTVLYFSNILWPKLTIWHFFNGLFAYQKARISLDSFKSLQSTHTNSLLKSSSNFTTDRVQRFLSQLDSIRRNIIVNLSKAKSKLKSN